MSNFESKLLSEIMIINGLIFPLCTDAANSSQSLSEFVSNTDSNNLLAKMATHLDQKSRVNQYWLHLGYQFKLSSEKLKELEYGQHTQVVMEYLYKKKPKFSIGEFYEVVKKLRRNDVLKKLDPFIAGEFVNGCLHLIIGKTLK